MNQNIKKWLGFGIECALIVLGLIYLANSINSFNLSSKNFLKGNGLAVFDAILYLVASIGLITYGIFGILKVFNKSKFGFSKSDEITYLSIIDVVISLLGLIYISMNVDAAPVFGWILLLIEVACVVLFLIAKFSKKATKDASILILVATCILAAISFLSFCNSFTLGSFFGFLLYVAYIVYFVFDFFMVESKNNNDRHTNIDNDKIIDAKIGE